MWPQRALGGSRPHLIRRVTPFRWLKALGDRQGASLNTVSGVC